MRQIGQIKQIQVQRTSLKRGEKPQRYYDPSPILPVEQLLLTSRGVFGITAQREQFVDVHHADHPTSRHRQENSVSVGFTSHYRRMRERFGEHLVDGVAGENILVETSEEFSLEDLGARLAIQARQSGELAYLEDLSVATPCVEFSRFALNELMAVPAETLRGALIFLDAGRRGFYANVSVEKIYSVRVGDSVFVEAEV
jgi:hypothetical protein